MALTSGARRCPRAYDATTCCVYAVTGGKAALLDAGKRCGANVLKRFVAKLEQLVAHMFSCSIMADVTVAVNKSMS